MKFLLLYACIGLLLAFWILYSKKSKPSKLNLRKTRTNMPDIKGKTRYTGDAFDTMKNLDCYFMYNGHEFNAYEVLGLPAGASPEMVAEAYKKLKPQADPSQLEFLECAYRALRER